MLASEQPAWGEGGGNKEEGVGGEVGRARDSISPVARCPLSRMNEEEQQVCVCVREREQAETRFIL